MNRSFTLIIFYHTPTFSSLLSRSVDEIKNIVLSALVPEFERIILQAVSSSSLFLSFSFAFPSQSSAIAATKEEAENLIVSVFDCVVVCMKDAKDGKDFLLSSFSSSPTSLPRIAACIILSYNPSLFVSRSCFPAEMHSFYTQAYSVFFPNSPLPPSANALSTEAPSSFSSSPLLRSPSLLSSTLTFLYSLGMHNYSVLLQDEIENFNILSSFFQYLSPSIIAFYFELSSSELSQHNNTSSLSANTSSSSTQVEKQSFSPSSALIAVTGCLAVSAHLQSKIVIVCYFY